MYRRNRSGWWDDTDSSSDSSYGSSRSNNSDHPVWESHITSQGELFYLEKKPKVPEVDSDPPKVNQAALEKPPSGILVKLIRRRSSLRNMKKNDQESTRGTSPPKQRVSEFYQWKVDLAEDRSGGKCQLESQLGLIVEPNKSRLVISRVKPEYCHLYLGSSLAPGDALCYIDNQLVTSDNVESILLGINNKEVILKFRSCRLRKGSNLHKDVSFASSWQKEEDKFEAKEDTSGGWLVYSRPGDVKEGSPLEEAILYRYPPPGGGLNPLVKSAGSFYTLAHLIPSFFTKSPPISSTICYEGSLVNIIYTVEGKDIMLLGLPEQSISLNEAQVLNQSLVRCLRFSYQSLSRCFSKSLNRNVLDGIISSFFKGITDRNIPEGGCPSWQFETSQPACPFLPIPKEIQVQLGDAMNELESNDIKEFDSHRLYSVIGSSFFHKGYLIRWHTNREDLVDIGCYLRLSQMLDLSSDGVDEMVCWKEVFPPSVQRGLSHSSPPQPYSVLTSPHSRWFLMVVAQDHDLLSVLLESGGCTARMEGNPGPNAIYIDEAQATLEHIQSLGIPKFISKWLEVHSGTEADETNSNPSPTHRSQPSIDSTKSPNVGSVKILDSPLNTKHRNSIDFPSIPNWDESVKLKSLSLPNVCGGPVLGRRAERERASETNSQSRVSESDISEESDTRDGRSADSNSLFDMNEFGKSLPQDCRNLPISRLGVAEGGVFHYVQLDSTEGVMVTNLMQRRQTTMDFDFVLDSFRKYAHHIHLILANTVSFKKLKPQEIATSSLNRSLIAVKEHGILFNGFKGEGNKKIPATYWVVGRLFFTPQLKEVFVCYEDSCPHNMIEIAFRIALNSYI